jgi:glutathione peroxidase
MTARQKILTKIYPLWMFLTNLIGKRSSTYKNNANMKPPVPFHNLSAILNNGNKLAFADLKGKKVLIVNTASDCGYTNQYEDLQKLYEQNQDKLVVIGFPANDFKEQEKGNDEEIAAFCKLNYGVTFPLAKKSSVIGANKNEVFNWLSDKNKNGWNEQEPVWNFSKYLVSEDGVLLQYFDPGISPTGNEIITLLNEKGGK